jgi:acyl carrier protein
MTSTDEARTLIAQATGRSCDGVPENAEVGQFPAWDSLAHMRLVLSLEERLGRLLSSEEVVGIRSLDDLAILLERDEGS